MTLAVFHDFPGLENGLTKFHDFPGRVVSLLLLLIIVMLNIKNNAGAPHKVTGCSTIRLINLPFPATRG